MKKAILSAAALALALAVQAQGLSLRDEAQMSSAQRSAAAAALFGRGGSAGAKLSRGQQAEYVTALVRLSSDADLAELGADVVEVKRCRGGFSILALPASEARTVAEHPAVKSFSLAKPVDMKLDRARRVSGVDKIHTGEGLPTKFTGRGVVCGVVDNGIDPNHVNFLFPDGSNRISMLSAAGIDRNGQPTTKIYTPLTLPNYTTDDSTTYHGTHTLGIMTGSYDGEGKMAYAADNGDFNIDENCARTPYYGVAPSSDLAVGAGSDYDAYIVYNIENILDYAYQTNQRAVINLSLGSSLGPHDGSTALNQYLDYVCIDGDYEIDGETYHGDNAIICISAGNEGDMPIAWNKTLDSSNSEAKTFFVSLIEDDEAAAMGLKNMRMGQLYVYGNDERPFQIQLVAWNNQRNRAAWSKTLVEETNAVQYYCSGSQYQQDDTDIVDAAFANYFEGYVGMGTGVDPDNGRYYAILDIAAIDNVEGTFNKNEEYSLGIIVNYIAEDGAPQTIEAYGDADGYQGMGSLGKEGWIQPSGNGTISDMACGKNQIIVGSYNTRDSWLSLDGTIYGYGEGLIPEGEVTDFSSWGTLSDGRNLPHVLAPGAAIVSSSNLYYHTNPKNVYDGYNPQHPGVRQGETSFADRSHYWVQMSGTSMASPFVAGALALWLEADPSLNVQKIRGIIEKTAVKDDYTAKVDPVKSGAGKFDAYEGLKEVLRTASVIETAADATSDNLMIRSLGSGSFEVCLPGAGELSVALVDMLGRTVAACSADGDTATISAPAGAKGVYAISVNGVASQKLVIR